MKYVKTEKAPQAIGPYSQAIISGGFVFCSGQIGLDPHTQELTQGIEAQTHQVLKNIRAVLNEAGTDCEKVVKTTIFVANMDDFGTVNEIYGTYFPVHKPARATVEVSNLPKGALVEIEAIAEV